MTCGDISEETYRQNYRFYETTYHLDDRHQRKRKLQPPRHTRSVEDVLIIMFRTCKIRDKKSKQRNNRCHRYITCYISTEREERD